MISCFTSFHFMQEVFLCFVYQFLSRRISFIAFQMFWKSFSIASNGFATEQISFIHNFHQIFSYANIIKITMVNFILSPGHHLTNNILPQLKFLFVRYATFIQFSKFQNYKHNRADPLIPKFCSHVLLAYLRGAVWSLIDFCILPYFRKRISYFSRFVEISMFLESIWPPIRIYLLQ